MIKIKIELAQHEFHTEDPLSDSVLPSGRQRDTVCEGYKKFCGMYPDFQAWLLSNPPGNQVSQSQKVFYMRFLKEKNGEEPLVASIFPVEAEKIGAILLAKAELLFQNIALLCEKGVNTRAEEEKLLHLKEAIQCLSQYKNNCVAQVLQATKMTEATKFGVLRRLPNTVSQFIETVDGEPVGCILVPYCENLYILVPAVVDAAPPLKLTFDGKNFIAVYTENLPKLPESVTKILSLPPAQG